MSSRVVSLSVAMFTAAEIAAAQVIPIQTVPLVPADQFDIFPSLGLAMGGVSIALADTLHDPFVNPATGARLRTAHLLGSPTFYGVSDDAGAGRTLPLALFTAARTWFGGLALAVQQLDAGRRTPKFDGGVQPLAETSGQLAPSAADLRPEAQTHGNALAFATLGTTLPGSGLSLGASIRWAKLRAIDGVDMLYPGSTRVEQFGETSELRFGLLKEWLNGQSLDAIVVHNRFRMTHDVTFLDTFWDPGSQRLLQTPRVERNRDVTDRWGVQLKYGHPLAGGWRIGWLATANRVSQPNVPNDDVLSIPRNPGHVNAYELGAGVSRTYGSSLFGMDLVYQPAWSTTSDTAFENDFRFSNAVFRMGVSHDVLPVRLEKTLALQLGLMVRAVHYNLSQQDLVAATSQRLEESWLEWTPTWGVSFRFADLELRYRGLATHGTDRMIPQAPGSFVALDQRPNGIFAFPGPATQMALEGVHVVTHQVSISVPLK